jgi:hypothetical protein
MNFALNPRDALLLKLCELECQRNTAWLKWHKYRHRGGTPTELLWRNSYLDAVRECDVLAARINRLECEARGERHLRMVGG